MRTIEVFADVRCPFTHVGLRRLAARREELGRGVVVRVRAWPLELVNGAPLDVDLLAEEIAALRSQVAPDLFAGFDPRTFPTTSLPALALTAGASRAGPEVAERVALAVRWALFEQGHDVADPDVLADLARTAGAPVPEPQDDEQVRADWAEGRQRGVVGSPHFFLGGHGYFCPMLRIAHGPGGLRITEDHAAFEAFAAAAAAAPPEEA